MMVTATSVDAEPIGVMLPPKFAPNITAHQMGESLAICMPPRIFAIIAASGMLSVTELATAEAAINDYIGGLDEWLTDTFLSHHNRTKFIDNDWKLLWDDVSKVDARMATKEQEQPAEHDEPVH